MPLLIMVYADPAFEERGRLRLCAMSPGLLRSWADIVKTSYPDDLDDVSAGARVVRCRWDRRRRSRWG